jgi:hypothetical protein
LRCNCSPVAERAAGAVRTLQPGAYLRRPGAARCAHARLSCMCRRVTAPARPRRAQGSQFVRGFGGVGGLLRYAVDTSQFEVDEDDLDDREWDSDEDI